MVKDVNPKNTVGKFVHSLGATTTLSSSGVQSKDGVQKI